MPRFYITLTWDDWPEGGSYGTVVEAEDTEKAEVAAKLEMAQLRTEDSDSESDDSFDPVQEFLENYENDWHVVDCFDLDGFIANHTRKE